MQLPQVHVVGLEQLERLVDHAQRGFAGAFLGLGGEKCLVAPVGHDLADVLLAPALGPAVDGRSVNVVYAQIERPLNDGHGRVKVVAALKGGLAAKGEDAHLVAGLAQVARGHGRRCYGIRRQAGQRLGCQHAIN